MPPTAATIGMHGPRRIAQVARDELAFEFDADDEEEDRQQAVGGPGRQVQVQVQCGRTHRELRNVLVDSRPRRVGPDKRAAAATSSRIPPTVSLRRISAKWFASDQEPRVSSPSACPGRHQARTSSAKHSTWCVNGNASNTRNSRRCSHVRGRARYRGRTPPPHNRCGLSSGPRRRRSGRSPRVPHRPGAGRAPRHRLWHQAVRRAGQRASYRLGDEATWGRSASAVRPARVAAREVSTLTTCPSLPPRRLASPRTPRRRRRGPTPSSTVRAPTTARSTRCRPRRPRGAPARTRSPAVPRTRRSTLCRPS